METKKFKDLELEHRRLLDKYMSEENHSKGKAIKLKAYITFLETEFVEVQKIKKTKGGKDGNHN